VTDFVVDTNVAIVANGRNTHADLVCRRQCVEMLEDLCKSHAVVLDDRYRILGEYRGHLNFSGAPGMGDVFFKHVLNHMHDGKSVRIVPITPCTDECRGFTELPKNRLDPSDRKFLAVAVVAQAEILNATDSDWSEREALTSDLGVSVRQLCPRFATKQASGG